MMSAWAVPVCVACCRPLGIAFAPTEAAIRTAAPKVAEMIVFFNIWILRFSIWISVSVCSEIEIGGKSGGQSDRNHIWTVSNEVDDPLGYRIPTTPSWPQGMSSGQNVRIGTLEDMRYVRYERLLGNFSCQPYYLKGLNFFLDSFLYSVVIRRTLNFLDTYSKTISRNRDCESCPYQYAASSHYICIRKA